nr:hypothetical protein [Treponema sp.]
MLENYLYSMPKRKKIFYAFLIAMTFVSLLSVNLSCGPFSWLAGEVTDNITDEIFTSINQSIGEAIGSMLDWFFDAILEPFGPSLTTFEENTEFGKVTLADFIQDFSIYTGMLVATLVFWFSIYTYFVRGKISECKDTPISLFARYVLAIIICYKNETI